MKPLAIIRKFWLLLCLSCISASAYPDTVWTFLTHPDFVNMTPGADGRWGNADDVFLGTGVDANPLGAATIEGPASDSGYTFFTSGFATTAGDVPTGSSVLEQIEAYSVIWPLGLGYSSPSAAERLDPAETSTWTIGAAQDVAFDVYVVGGTLSGPGYIFYPGDTAAGIVGDGPLAEHIDYMLNRITGNYYAAVYFNLNPGQAFTIDGLLVAQAPPVTTKSVPLPYWLQSVALALISIIGGTQSQLLPIRKLNKIA